MLLEKQIENNILMFLREIGIIAWKNQTVGIYDAKAKAYRKSNNVFHRKGVSDILGILPDGRFLAIEVKSKVGRPSPEQLKFISDIQSKNGIAFISRSVEQTFDQLRHWLPESDKFLNTANKWTQYEGKLS